jgi:ketosteroid isomerase-like protein
MKYRLLWLLVLSVPGLFTSALADTVLITGANSGLGLEFVKQYAACGGSASPQPTLEQDLAAIADFNARYLQAINDEDIDALSALTTEGHIILIPNRAPIVGKAANDAANASAFERFDFTETWSPEETVVSGDWAHQRGTYLVISVAKDGSGERRVMGGSFLRIYERQPDGEWRMTRDMFNSDGVTRD